DEIDEDGSGSVTFEEFQAWYSKVFNVEINPDRTDFITIDIVPADQRMLREVSKKLSLDNLKVESLWKEFKKLDQDSSGSLDQEEFKVIVQQILSPTNPRADKVEVPEKVMHKFWIEVDTDNSGSVNFEEFAAWYMKCFDGSASPMEQYYSKLGSNFRTTVVERTVTNMALEAHCELALMRQGIDVGVLVSEGQTYNYVLLHLFGSLSFPSYCSVKDLGSPTLGAVQIAGRMGCSLLHAQHTHALYNLPNMDADLYTFTAQEGDLLVLGTDGLFDNLFIHEVCQLAGEAMGPLDSGSPTDPATIAQALVKAAFHRSIDRAARSPFGEHAKQARKFVNPVLFTVFGFKVYSYGVMVASALASCTAVLSSELKRLGIEVDAATIMLAFIPGFWAGSKVHMIVSALAVGEAMPNLGLETGHSFMGSAVGGVMSAALYGYWCGLRPLALLDMIAPLVPLGHAVGKWGCFLSGDGCYGPPASADLPWAMSFPNGLLPTSEAVHPTPLYESFLSFVLFTFLHWGFSLPSTTSGRTRAVGTRSAVTLGLYGVVRMSIEPWRRHPVSDYLLGLTEYQFLAVIFILLGG
ncbi:unnamed protein product, partial [Polarella glacialis]